MSRDEQIEEMATIICQNTEFDTMWGECYQSAEALYNAGYRKASDVAREVVEDMREMIKGYENIDVYLDRIEKKYTEDGE